MVKSDDINDTIYSDFYHQLELPDQRQIDVFKKYLDFIHYCFHLPRLENILEIGAGNSTVLLGYLASCRKGCRVYSIDFSYDSVLTRIKEDRLRNIVKDNVSIFNGASVSTGEFWSFWDRQIHSGIDNVTVAQIKKHLSEYVRLEFGSRKWQRLEQIFNKPRNQMETESIFFTAEGMRLPKEIVDIYSEPTDEFSFYRNNSTVERGAIDDILQKTKSFDVIFFDGGEFSAIPEWLKLKDKIRVGGLAAFHDIYFPKSFKNFLVCASVAADPNWAVAYQDRRTPQGLLIAQRQ